MVAFTHSRPTRPAIHALRGAVLTATLLAACGPATVPERTPSERLLVANAHDGTLTTIDPHRVAVTSSSIPVGSAPWQVAEGPAGSLVVLSSSVEHVGHLVHVKPPARFGGPWQIGRIPTGLRVRSGHLAADGHRFAVVAYSQAAAPGAEPPQHAFCGIEVVDLIAGRVTGTHGVCAAGREVVTGLALTSGPAGTVAIVGVYSTPAETPRRADGLNHRLIAVAVGTGHLLASVFVAGAPSNLSLAHDPATSALRLYAVLAPPDLPADARLDRSRLLLLDPDTLAPSRHLELAFFPTRLTFSADGTAAYALDDTGTALVYVDLTSGSHRRLTDLPSRSTSLAFASGALYVPHSYGTSLWRVDPHTGTITHTVPVGRHPTTVALSLRP